MNKAILVGRLTRDPELNYTGSNIPVANFTVAISRPFTNQSGEREADFINVVVWRKQAENVKNYVFKGSQVAVEGRIQTRSYDAQDGTKRYVTEVVADSVQFLDSKQQNQQREETKEEQQPEESNGTNVENDPFADFGSNIEIDDDELPF